MSKHTQGPWIATYKSCCNLFELTASNGKEILCNHYVGGDIDGDHYGAVKKEADARLIASSPELLEALIHAKNMLESISLDLTLSDRNPSLRLIKIIRDANVAIKKAEGEQQ